MLKVSYLAEDQLAELVGDDLGECWLSVRRVCEERSEGINNISATRLTLPWWSFLACRSAIGFVLGQFGQGLELDLESRRLLTAALEVEQRYREVGKSERINPGKLLGDLERAGFRRALTKQQLRNVSTLVGLPSGASFSVPGAGKTTEALAFYAARRQGKQGLLVVAPKNAFAAWEEQLALCCPSLPQFVRLRGGLAAIRDILHGRPQLAIITYQQLAIARDLIAAHLSANPTFVFLDESHRMKGGADRVQGGAILSLSHLPVAKLILSGTPVPNSLADIVPQFDFLFPEVRADEQSVQKLIAPVYVRTTKAELGLPPVQRRYVDIPMSSAQKHLYNLMRSEEARQAEAALGAGERNALRALGRSVVRLIQMVSNPGLLARDAFSFPNELREVLEEGDSPKIAYVSSRVRELAGKGRKTIVWSGFIQNVELLAAKLKDLGADFIHGGVDAGSDEDSDTREAKIRRFHEDDEAWVLVANPAACGEGISLHTVCHDAIYLDRNFNAAQYLQSEDRIHRLGLPKKQVTRVEIVSCPESIDESVRRRLESKVARMAEVLNDPSLTIEPTSVEIDGEGLDGSDIEEVMRHFRAKA